MPVINPEPINDPQELERFGSQDTFANSVEAARRKEAGVLEADVTYEFQGDERQESVMKRLHDYFPDSDEFQEMVGNLITLKDPEKQQEKMAEYAKKIAEKILPYLNSPDSHGALLAFDYPLDFESFQKLLYEILFKVDDACQKDHIRFNDVWENGADYYFEYQTLVRGVRKEVIGLIEQELVDGGLGRQILVQDRKLGIGGMGNVYECELADKNVAMKFHRQPLSERSTWSKEKIEKLRQATRNNENLSKFLGAFHLTSNQDEPWDDIEHFGADVPQGHYDRRVDLFELFEGGTDLGAYLHNQEIKTFNQGDEFERMRFNDFLEHIYLPMLNGVKGMHDEDLVHRDMKSQNVMIIPTNEPNRPMVKLIDYDLYISESGFQEPDPSVIVGTPSMMSPEQVRNDVITEKSDIYTLGKMLYEWLGGKLDLENMWSAIKQTESGEYNTEELDIPDDLKQIITDSMELEPTDRPTIDELIVRVKDLVEKNKEELGKIEVKTSAAGDTTVTGVPTADFGDSDAKKIEPEDTIDVQNSQAA